MRVKRKRRDNSNMKMKKDKTRKKRQAREMIRKNGKMQSRKKETGNFQKAKMAYRKCLHLRIKTTISSKYRKHNSKTFHKYSKTLKTAKEMESKAK